MSGKLGSLDSLAGVPLHEAMENTGVGIVACDADGRLTLLSPAMQEQFGLAYDPLQEALLPETFRLYQEDGETPLPQREMPLARARLGEFVRDVVVGAHDKNGALVFLKCNAAPLADDDGAPAGALVLIQDVTAERQARLDTADLRARLVQTMNHEFRTPLAALLGNLEIIHDHHDQVDPDLARSLAAIERAGWRLRDLVCAAAGLIERDELQQRGGRTVDGAPLAS